jgi:predicted RNA binding protein YcfA (HicA-like mRNA interferase family)
VPFHKGRDISPVLLRKIAQDIRMSAQEFIGVRE